MHIFYAYKIYANVKYFELQNKLIPDNENLKRKSENI